EIELFAAIGTSAASRRRVAATRTPTAPSCPPFGASDAAAQPVKPAVRCGRKMKPTTNWESADLVSFRCGCANGNF
ncbi:MAG: hypothetical protein AAFQ58_23775, partial [Pseudomonadota bacterium]